MKKKLENVTILNDLNSVELEFSQIVSAYAGFEEQNDMKMRTFSPLNMVHDFTQRGINKVEEVSFDEMMANQEGMQKLLANMLAQCSPDSLSAEDTEFLSGINGRKAQARV